MYTEFKWYSTYRNILEVVDTFFQGQNSELHSFLLRAQLAKELEKKVKIIKSPTKLKIHKKKVTKVYRKMLTGQMKVKKTKKFKMKTTKFTYSHG